MDYIQELGKTMYEERKKRGLKLRECAKSLKINPVRLRDYELGNRIPSLEELKRISDLLGIDVDFEIHEKELTKIPPKTEYSKPAIVTCCSFGEL